MQQSKRQTALLASLLLIVPVLAACQPAPAPLAPLSTPGVGLGITADVTDRVRDLQARLGDPLRVLANARQGDLFLRALGTAGPHDDGRLIKAPASEAAEQGPAPSGAAEAAVRDLAPVAAGNGTGV